LKTCLQFQSGFIAVTLAATALVSGCRSPSVHRENSDDIAYRIVDETRKSVGHAEPFSIEPPSVSLRKRLLLDQNLLNSGPMSLGTADINRPGHWPDDEYFDQTDKSAGPGEWKTESTLKLSLFEALQVAARNSREYQSEKEGLFQTALSLDLARESFRTSLASALSGSLGGERDDGETSGSASSSASADGSRKLERGVDLTTEIAVDLTKLLTGDKSSTLGHSGDASISIPLLRGSGRHIVRESLTQAERNMVYAVYEFELFKKDFAVQVASEYLGVLNRMKQVDTAWENYNQLRESERRARRLADAGRIPEIQVDQATQSELRARDRWVSARQSSASALDSFKVTLGLPPDAGIELDRDELDRLRAQARAALSLDSDEKKAGEDATEPTWESSPGKWEMAEDTALKLAMNRRLDLKVVQGQAEDAQRAVIVAADQLRGELTILGEAGYSSSETSASDEEEEAEERFSSKSRKGFYSALLSIDLPLERTAEAHSYRTSLISLEDAVRDAQSLEDQIKIDVRSGLRNLAEARESILIQAQAVALARRREKSTNLFLQAGRAEIRDLLEAQESLISAEDTLTSVTINYRLAELELQKDLGLLQVNEEGLWIEATPEDVGNDR
jgi:outer membrane protein TolC